MNDRDTSACGRKGGEMKVLVDVSDSDIERIRKFFRVNKKVTNYELAHDLLLDLSWRYMTPQYWSQEDIDEIVDDILTGRKV